MATSSPYDGEPPKEPANDNDQEHSFVRARTLPAPPLDAVGLKRQRFIRYIVSCVGAGIFLLLIYGLTAPLVGRIVFNRLLGIRIPWIVDYCFLGAVFLGIATYLAFQVFRRKA